MCGRLLVGSVQPTTTNSSRFRHFDLTQIPRSRGAYGWSARFEMAPSRPSLHAFCSEAETISDDVDAEEQAVDLLPEQPVQPLLAFDQRQRDCAMTCPISCAVGEPKPMLGRSSRIGGPYAEKVIGQ